MSSILREDTFVDGGSDAFDGVLDEVAQVMEAKGSAGGEGARV